MDGALISSGIARTKQTGSVRSTFVFDYPGEILGPLGFYTERRIFGLPGRAKCRGEAQYCRDQMQKEGTRAEALIPPSVDRDTS
jgi:hypothetical protein